MDKPTVKILLKENFKLKEELEIAEDRVKIQAAQLRKFGKIFDNCSGKEVNAEFNEEEFNKNKKGESDHGK